MKLAHEEHLTNWYEFSEKSTLFYEHLARTQTPTISMCICLWVLKIGDDNFLLQQIILKSASPLD